MNFLNVYLPDFPVPIALLNHRWNAAVCCQLLTYACFLLRETSSASDAMEQHIRVQHLKPLKGPKISLNCCSLRFYLKVKTNLEKVVKVSQKIELVICVHFEKFWGLKHHVTDSWISLVLSVHPFCKQNSTLLKWCYAFFRKYSKI